MRAALLNWINRLFGYSTLREVERADLESEIVYLRNLVASERARNRELEDLIFKKFGLISGEKSQAEKEFKPIQTRQTPWSRRRYELENKDLEAYWREKNSRLANSLRVPQKENAQT